MRGTGCQGEGSQGQLREFHFWRSIRIEAKDMEGKDGEVVQDQSIGVLSCHKEELELYPEAFRNWGDGVHLHLDGIEEAGLKVTRMEEGRFHPAGTWGTGALP